MVLSPQELAARLDHTLLAPGAQADEIRGLCDEALEHGFFAVCVNGAHVPLASRLLDRANVKVASTIGFPLGAASSRVKLFEAADALGNGADELDMVLSLGALKSGEEALVVDEIATILRTCEEHGALLKVILELGLLTPGEKVRATQLSLEAGAHFLKTSTGFSAGGATLEDVRMLRARAPEHVGVKAAGGIRTAEHAQRMIAAGATRIGCSSSVTIMRELRASK